ncbi:MAG: hypothetical protein IPH88_08740 [Bacteroidales bacterium]|nr:hypothetical protein [Bacteroidales bacterium]
MVRSKLKAGYVLWFIWMLLCAIGTAYLLYLLYGRRDINGFNLTLLWCSVIFSLFLVIILSLKDFKYFVIDTDNRKARWYSILRPWGGTILFENYAGKIKPFLPASGEAFPTAYLLNPDMETSFKISGRFYKNYIEMYQAIGIREVKLFDISLGQYVRLWFTGKLKIKVRQY